MAEEIIRSLMDGPDYWPDWRNRAVQNYLTEVMEAACSDARLAAIMDTEKDPFVRQFLRFRFNGRSVNAVAFRYAVGCQDRNPTTGSASMIKAMLVADRAPEEIAEELGTETRNIVAFAKIFFDVRRYLNNEAWLRRIVFAETPEGAGQAEALRERRWLAAAYHRGWEGVEHVVFHRSSGKAESVEALSVRLQETLASRALEYALDLETNGTTPTESDLHRFLAARNTQARLPQVPTDNQETMRAFLKGVQASVEEEADQHPHDPKYDGIRELKRLRETGASEPRRRLRARFAGG